MGNIIWMELIIDAPWITIGYILDKPIISWKYHELKMHLMHLTYWTSYLDLAYLKYAQNIHISLQLGNII